MDELMTFSSSDILLCQFFCSGFVNGPKLTGVWWGAGVDDWAALNWVWHQKQQDTTRADFMGSDPGPSRLRQCMRLQWECSCLQFLMKAMSVYVNDGQLLRRMSGFPLCQNFHWRNWDLCLFKEQYLNACGFHHRVFWLGGTHKDPWAQLLSE